MCIVACEPESTQQLLKPTQQDERVTQQVLAWVRDALAWRLRDQQGGRFVDLAGELGPCIRPDDALSCARVLEAKKVARVGEGGLTARVLLGHHAVVRAAID